MRKYNTSASQQSVVDSTKDVQEQVSLAMIETLIGEAYIPFAEVERAIPWPTMPEQLENDAEHSWSLAFVSLALAEKLGLDSGKVSRYAICHDFVERYAGDTSAWDDEGLQTKVAREAEALAKITDEFGSTPIIAQTIHAYESQNDEESRFVYALDKLLALLMVVSGEGAFWKRANISFREFIERNEIIISKVQAHPQVASWYGELTDQITSDRYKYFSK